MAYDYKKSHERVIDELTSKTKIEPVVNPTNNKLTYENGARSHISAVFVDIRNSSSFIKSGKDDMIARILRAFSSELIKIMKDGPSYLQIGLRGDCVYAVYPTPKENDDEKVFTVACYINTFINMFNKVLLQNKMKEIKVGIGLGTGNDLVIKAGDNGSGINDVIWIGDAVVDASNNCDLANKTILKPIVMSSSFYNYIKTNPKYIKDFGTPIVNNGVTRYACNYIISDFDKWITNGFKE